MKCIKERVFLETVLNIMHDFALKHNTYLSNISWETFLHKRKYKKKHFYTSHLEVILYKHTSQFILLTKCTLQS